MKDRRQSLKRVYLGTKPRRRAPHAHLKKTEKPLCPHGCEAPVQLAAENSVDQLWSCTGCYSLIKVKKEVKNNEAKEEPVN